MIYVDPEELGRVAVILTQKNYCTIPRAAVAIGVCTATCRTYVKKGYLRSFWIGGRRMIALEEIQRFREEGNYKEPVEVLDPELD